MKSIHIGLSTNNLSSLLHEDAFLNSEGGLTISGFLLTKEEVVANKFDKPIFSHSFSGPCLAQMKEGLLTVGSSNHNDQFFCINRAKAKEGAQKLLSILLVKPASGHFTLNNKRNTTINRTYTGQLIIVAEGSKLRLILHCNLETYVHSVLRGEIPAYFHDEAIKAQAICARTYALNPRVNHSNDYCNVCDSYQCCQAFIGAIETGWSGYANACNETAGEILSYKNSPALALFSSCAGGHTENYEDCFSDFASGAFPPAPIPYLKGISENLDLNPLFDEAYLRTLWQAPEPKTVDSWSKQFRWSVRLTNEELEMSLHHNIASLMQNKQFAPFIVPPKNGLFGEILSFNIGKRGIGGTAIDLSINTSKGNWKFVKELTIRSLFQNTKPNLKRLASARMFFDQQTDKSGNLVNLHIYGLGSGHGVGLQQIGAQGLAKIGKTYREILEHYYKNIVISKI